MLNPLRAPADEPDMEERRNRRFMDWFALALLWVGGTFFFCAATAALFGDMQLAMGFGIFGAVLAGCGALAKGASIAGDSVEGHAAKKPKTRLQSIVVTGVWLAYFGGAVIYNWGKPFGFLLLAIWLFSAFYFVRFLRAKEFHSGDLITLQWEGWFHAARVLEAVDGGYLVRLFTERATHRPSSIVPATLAQMEYEGKSTIVNVAAEYLDLCDPELVYEGDLSENDLNEISLFFAYTAGAGGYA